MLRRKRSKKHGFSFNDIPVAKVSKKAKLRSYHPNHFFKDLNKVGSALLESLIQNDTQAFIEILDAYLQVNKTRVAKRAKVSRSTVQHALSKRGNPTLRTLAKIVHKSIA